MALGWSKVRWACVNAAIGTAFAVTPLAVAAGDHPESGQALKPQDRNWVPCRGSATSTLRCAYLEGDPAKPGLFSYEISLPAGFDMPPHSHPVSENVVVLEGVYHAGVGNRLDKDSAVILEAGGFLTIPADTPHYAWSEGPVKVHVYGYGPSGIRWVEPTQGGERP